MTDPLEGRYSYVRAYKAILRLPLDLAGSGVAEPCVKHVLCVLIDRHVQDRWPVAYSVLGFEAGGYSAMQSRRAVRRLIKGQVVKIKARSEVGMTYEINFARIERLIMMNTPKGSDHGDPGHGERSFMVNGGGSVHGEQHPNLSQDKKDSSSIGNSLVTNKERGPDGTEGRVQGGEPPDRPPPDDEPMPRPPDLERLNGWHEGEKAGWLVMREGRVEEWEEGPYCDGDVDDLKRVNPGAIIIPKLFKRWLDKGGAVIRPEAVIEERELQKKYCESVSRNGGQTNVKAKTK